MSIESFRPGGLYIGGDWVSPAQAATRTIVDPSTGAATFAVAEAGAEDVAVAVAAAHDAFHSRQWAGLLPAERAALLFAVADGIEARAAEFVRLETLDLGQPEWVAQFSVAATVEHFRYFAGWATKLSGDSTPLSQPNTIQRTVRVPLGVAALIVPWNFPLQIAGWKIAPALAAGNVVILKPAEQTPLSALLLAEVVAEAGFPAGVFNVVTGGPELGRALVEHPGVAKVSFTGSVDVGREIAATAGHRLAATSLELGGKTASVVTPSADFAAAVQGHVGGGLYNSGQTCAAFSRIYVHESIVEEFTRSLADEFEKLCVGPGTDPGSVVGPLVTEEHRARVHRYVEQGVEQGGVLVTGGHPLAPEGHEGGYYYAPTVISVDDDNIVAREEIFGPVLAVLSYRDEEEVLRRVNSSEYALAAVVWSRDIGEANRLAEGITAGTVWINSGPILDAASPWGGFRASGGGRESGWEALLAFTGVKTVITSTI
jgi:acyl-CoA reductase-like NAD-dependent aldehyde dehydrogenase